MPLAADIAALRDQVLADLSAAHDYYTNTKQAWRVVQRYVDSGQTVDFLNVHTGNKVPPADIPSQAQFYVTQYLASATLQQFVSHLEDFVLGLIRLWLRSFPHRLRDRKVSGAAVFAAKDIDEVREHLIQQHVLDTAYKSLADLFASLSELVELKHPAKDEIERLAEIKASRDVLVHNRGVVNATYVQKVGARKRFDVGDRLEVSEPYHLECWGLIRKVVTDIAGDAIAKAPR
ncbi:MAG: hypothetical protein ACRC33_27490 [Gemmataceae bacterium]